MVAALAVWLVGGLGIASMVPEDGGTVAQLVAFMSLIIVAVIGLTYLPGARRVVPAACAAANALAGLAALGAMRIIDEPDAAAPITLAIYFAFTIFRLHPLPAALGAAPYVAVHQVMILDNHRDGLLGDAGYAVASMMPVAAFLSGVIVSVVLERRTRQTFVNERIIEQQRREIATERDRAETLLLNILPAPIAERLKENADIIADRFDEVTVLFADVVGFTPMSARVPPEETVTLLDRVFSAFDALAEKFGVEKIKTIGDAYMAVAGLPEPSPDHAETMADFALAVRDAAFDLGVTMRIGLATGPVVAGVIGTHKFAFDLWGDTVNTASRMESHGIPGEIQVPEATYRVLDTDYVLVERGQLTVKGKGDMTTWLLKGRR